MYRKWKASLISLAILFQVLTIIFAFIDITLALTTLALNILSFIGVLIVFIIERNKEKEEEIDYDDSDY
ncbi:hypothetical protein BpOF4_09800 [Alkalihalophilus pseudofirmus OF4]|uniref:Uncharacterized protein n=1 Tax=Alkalihalophilus pseudofirmus (strain ATCC BAA-2126 / JCM 17055 / OF4) TaxID=398511 RepID=D3FSP7_ALKPO|nr:MULTISPECIES: hypothetical protein [Alkalihalophilus]ADC50015.1 hypothetical protein BpOF4_09800 [Alkalihalophilus pseudofirmus OF4]MED1602838.1 hypothetical protein [Alkalihalophilus marmarensis]